MASQSANKPSGLASTGWPSVGQLWQAPVFLAGALAVCGAALFWAWASSSNPGGQLIDRNLARLRQALEQNAPPGDVEALGQTIVGCEETFPQQAATAHFLLGSYYLQADTKLPDRLQRARAHLEQAEALGVAAEDRDRLTYRLGKVYALTKEDPQRVLDYLKRSVPDSADDPAEGYGFLVQTYLRLPAPDVHAALEANQKQLALLMSEPEAAAARLQRGKLLLDLQQRDEARAVLARVPRDAPPAVYLEARTLRVQSCQQDGLWKEAAGLWKEVLTDTAHPPADVSRARYLLGLCYARDGRPEDAEDAVRAWEKALSARGETGQAAAFRLAELHLQRAPGRAKAAYDLALNGVTGTAEYKNSLVPLEEARRICELGCRRFLEASDYESAQQVANLYARLAAPGKAQGLYGEAAEAWANAHRKLAREAANEEMARREEDAACGQFCRAGAAFEAVAEVRQGQPEYADWLWRSAESYRHGGDLRRALGVLKRFLALKLPGPQLGEGWYVLARIYQAQDQERDARTGFRSCIAYKSPFAYRARYQLALDQLNHNEWDEAEKTLRQNLDMLHSDPDPEASETTLYALAGLLYRREKYVPAFQTFQEALGQFPTSPEAARARFRLGDCFRQLAAQENQRLQQLAAQENQRLQLTFRMAPAAQLHYQAQYRTWLGNAVANFQKLADDLATRQRQAPLTESEEKLLRDALFALANCRFDLGQYDGALTLFKAFADHFPHRVETLSALGEVMRCQDQLEQRADAWDTLGKIEHLLRELNAAAFGEGATGEGLRKQWENWLTESRQKLKPAVAPPAVTTGSGGK